MNAVRSRRPLFPKWSGAECQYCGLPVEIVTLDVDTRAKVERVEIERKASWQPVEGVQRIAVRVIGLTLHGYRIGAGRSLLGGYTPVLPHSWVCTEAPPPPHEQHGLPGL